MSHPHPSRRTVLALGAMAAAAAALPAKAADFSSRPVKIVVPFPPGNASDVAARILSERLGERLKTTVVVENKPGATGVIGVQAVVGADPDGHTLLLTSLSPLVLTPAIRKEMPYDVMKDLEPVALVGWTGMILITSNDFPAKTVGEVIELVRQNPGKFSYGHVGPGSLSHLSMRYFMRAAGLDIVEVPYRGSGQAITDIMTGRIHMMFDGMTSASPQVQAGKVRGVAVSSVNRSSLVPELPTLREAGVTGLKDYEVTGWTAVLAPPRTPKDVVATLNREIGAILQDPRFQETARAQFLEAYPAKPASDLADYMRTELKKWDEVAADAGVKATQ